MKPLKSSAFKNSESPGIFYCLVKVALQYLKMLIFISAPDTHYTFPVLMYLCFLKFLFITHRLIIRMIENTLDQVFKVCKIK